MKSMKSITWVLLWMLIGVSSMYWDVCINQQRQITVGDVITLGGVSAVCGPITTVLVILIEVSENWDKVIIEGTPDRKEK
jgi:hypothetical protein